MSEWPYDEARELQHNATQVAYDLANMDVLATLNDVRKANETLTRLATEVLGIAANQTKIPQRRLAEALGVSPSTLRGLRK